MNLIVIFALVLVISSGLFTLLLSVWISLLIISTEVQRIFVLLPYIIWVLSFSLFMNYYLNKLFLRKYNKISDYKLLWNMNFLLNYYKMSNKWIYIYGIFIFSLTMVCSLIIYTSSFFLSIMSFELDIIPVWLIDPALLSFPVLFFIILFIKIKLYKRLVDDFWISKWHMVGLVLLESFYYPVILKKKNK